MRGIILFSLLFLIAATGLYAQVDWIEHPIVTGYDGAWGVYAIDMDGDDDIDLVTSGYEADEITWWENDGNQHFLEHNIDANLDGAAGVHADDLNGDGDMDVIGVSLRGDEIAWYENNGQMNFTKYILVQNYSHPIFALMHDVDRDNDMDIVGSNHGNGDITWWENIGYPAFVRHDIDSLLDGCRQIDVSDLDNDGDADILAAAYGVRQIAWYENDGNQVFQKHVIQYGYKAFWAKPFDFNGDGAWDILGCSGGSNDDISWFENDGNMNFTKHVIDNNIDDPQSVEAADFDFDGDLDIVAALRFTDGISWWENHNNINFTKSYSDQSFDYAITVIPVDMDQDSDMDVIGSAFGSDKISWWQNLTIYEPGFVMGVVTDNYGSPIESVYVDPSGTNIYDFTDFYGYYELALPAAIYEITFQKNGYYEYTFPYVQVTVGDTAIVNVSIVQIPTGFVLGNVTDEYAVPLEDVYVFAENTSYYDSTDENGDYSLEVIAGIHDITFVKSGYYDTTIFDIGIALNDTIYEDMNMVQVMPGIWGKILNKEPTPVESVLVSVINTPISIYSDYYGEFYIEGLVQGVYDILFQHPYYFDTTITDISVEPGNWDSLYVVLESKSAITGFVADIDSIPLADVQVKTVGKNLFSYSDSTGHYFLRIIPETNYSIKYSKVNFLDQIVPNIMVSVEETLVLDSIYLQPRLAEEVIVWYGNPDLSPVTAPIGDTVLIDLYAFTAPYLDIGFVHLPLGTDDQYIVGHHSESEGVLYYPLTDWDDVRFLPPDDPPQLPPGWHSQSLLGFYDITGGPNPPLNCPETTRIASFAFEVANDTSLIGDTVDCLMEGFNPANSGPLFGDVNGVDPYYPFQFFSPLHFVEPIAGGCEYVVGDVNDSGEYNGLDITYGVIYFKGGPAPPYECECTLENIWHVAGDVNGSCMFNGLDVTFGVAYFKGGPDPVPCADCPPSGTVTQINIGKPDFTK